MVFLLRVGWNHMTNLKKQTCWQFTCDLQHIHQTQLYALHPHTRGCYVFAWNSFRHPQHSVSESASKTPDLRIVYFAKCGMWTSYLSPNNTTPQPTPCEGGEKQLFRCRNGEHMSPWETVVLPAGREAVTRMCFKCGALIIHGEHVGPMDEVQHLKIREAFKYYNTEFE